MKSPDGRCRARNWGTGEKGALVGPIRAPQVLSRAKTEPGLASHHGPRTKEGFFVGIFTFMLVVATFPLWVSTKALWEVGERQFQLIRTEFVTTYRPRLIARHVMMKADASPIGAVMLCNHGNKIFGVVSLVNVGGTDAAIVGLLSNLFQQVRASLQIAVGQP